MGILTGKGNAVFHETWVGPCVLDGPEMRIRGWLEGDTVRASCDVFVLVDGDGDEDPSMQQAWHIATSRGIRDSRNAIADTVMWVFNTGTERAVEDYAGHITTPSALKAVKGIIRALIVELEVRP